MVPWFFRAQIRTMQAYVPGEQPRQGAFLKLNTNENPYPPSPRVWDVLREIDADCLSRYPDPVATEFREVAGEFFGLPSDWFVAGNGSDDILSMIARAFLEPGTVACSFAPSYLLYRTLADWQGASYRELPFACGWTIPTDRQLYQGVQVVFLANPNSPSGTLVPVQTVMALAEQLECPLVIDEAYADFSGTSCVELVRRYPHVIVVRTLSKSHSLAGVRFGFAIAQPPVIEGLLKVKDSYNCDALSIRIAAKALADRDYTASVLARIAATRQRVQDALRRLGFEVPESRANFVWCTGGPLRPRRLYEELRGRGILVRYLDYGPWGDGVRITVGTDPDMDRLLQEIQLLLERGGP
jgi:histidinol-phosphate aminotransferase